MPTDINFKMLFKMTDDDDGDDAATLIWTILL